MYLLIQFVSQVFPPSPEKAYNLLTTLLLVFPVEPVTISLA